MNISDIAQQSGPIVAAMWMVKEIATAAIKGKNGKQNQDLCMKHGERIAKNEERIVNMQGNIKDIKINVKKILENQKNGRE